MIIHTPKELALYIQQARKQKKLSQSLTASQVGLKQNTVSHFELAPQTTQLDTLFRILSAVGLEMHITPKQKNSSQEW